MFKEIKKTNFADMVIYDQENKIYVELEGTAKTETQWKSKIGAYKASKKVFAFQSVLVQEIITDMPMKTSFYTLFV